MACRALSDRAQTVQTCFLAVRLPLLYTLQHGHPPSCLKRQPHGARVQSDRKCIELPWSLAARLAATPQNEVWRPHLSSAPVLSRSESEKMAERGKSSASSVAMKLVTLLLMQMTSLVTFRSLGSSQTCSAECFTANECKCAMDDPQIRLMGWCNRVHSMCYCSYQGAGTQHLR